MSDESADQIAAAIVAALGAMDELHRDKTAKVETKAGGSYSYSYTDLGSVLGYVRPILATHGLVVMQPATNDGNAVTVTTILLHRSGQERAFPPLSMPAGRTPQEIGSAITYARRYSLLSALGLATEDDDGAAATKATKATPRKAARPANVDEYGEVHPPAQPDRRRKRMFALYGELGIKERDQMLATASAVVGREITTSNDLTADEVESVITYLEGEPKP